MKATIYIVDDEPMAIRYLEAILKGVNLETEVIGSAPNGAKAIPEIARLHPDFVFLDISMPVMDGLKMSEEVLKQNPLQKIFMLTAYRDFEYAKKSVSIGVTDYILKNELSEEELEKLLLKHIEELNREKKQRHTMTENNIRKFLLAEKQSGDDLWVYPDKPMQRYVLFYIAQRPSIVLRHSEARNKHQVDCYEVENAASAKGIACRAFVEMFENEYCGIFFIQQDVDHATDQCKQIAKEIMDEFWADAPEFICLVSDPVAQFSMLPDLYVRLRKKLDYLYANEERLFLDKELPEHTEEEKHNYLDEWFMAWKAAIAEGKQKEAETLLLTGLHEKKENLSVWTYTESIQELYRYLRAQVKEKKLDLNVIHLEEYYSDLDQLEKDLLQSQNRYFDAWKMQVENEYSRYVITAQEYIQTHYKNDISVADIAQAADISEGHLRRCFKNELGINVVTYLMDYRLDCAKRLMKEGREGIESIWKETGFTSGQYFSYVFKKKEGITPSEYMRKGYHETGEKRD